MWLHIKLLAGNELQFGLQSVAGNFFRWINKGKEKNILFLPFPNMSSTEEFYMTLPINRFLYFFRSLYFSFALLMQSIRFYSSIYSLQLSYSFIDVLEKSVMYNDRYIFDKPEEGATSENRNDYFKQPWQLNNA